MVYKEKSRNKLDNGNLVEAVNRQVKFRSKYKSAANAVSYARKLSIFTEENKPLAKMLVNSDTAIGSVYRPEKQFRRLVWLFSYTLMLAMTLYTSVIVIEDYLERESVFELKVEESKVLLFPAITICNKNPIRKTALCANHHELFKQWKLNAMERRGLEALCKPNRSHLTPYTYRQMIPNLVEEDVIRTFGHDIKGINLRNCFMKRTRIYIGKIKNVCATTWFTEAIDMQAGRCWCIFCNTTHDEQYDIDNYRIYTQASARDGLVLLLDTEPFEHIDETSDGDGFLLKIHYPGEDAHPMIGAINLSVNQTTYIAIGMKVIERVPGSQPDLCISEFPSLMDYANTNKGYSQQSCTSACQQKIIAETCGCTVADLYNLTSNTEKPCHGAMPAQQRAEERNCASVLERLFQNPKRRGNYNVAKCGNACFNQMLSTPSRFFERCQKICRPRCNEVVYTHAISRAGWHASLRNEYPAGFFIKNNATDLVKAVIYFQAMSQEILTATPKMTYVEALVEVGGNFGTYLGLSVLIIYEISEIALRYLLKVYQRRTAWKG